MKVAILAYYFPPHPTVGATRPENWAEWLSEAHDVSVIAAFGNNSNSGARQTHYRLHPVGRPFVRLLEAINSWRKSSRERRAARGCSTKRTGSSSGSGAFTYRMPCLHDIWGVFAFLKLVNIRPDVVIATHSPYITLITGWLYCKWNRKCSVWLDFRDPWSGNKKMRGLYPFSSIERWIEKKAVASAGIVTAASGGFAKIIQKQTGRAHVDVITNTAPHWARSSTGSTTRNDNRVSIVYTGIVETGWRDPSPLFELLARLRSTPATRSCRITVASPNVGNLLQLAEHYNILDCIDFRGPLERAEALRLQQDSDILLLLEDTDTANAGVIPAKVFEYLLTDKPILLIGPSSNSEIHRLVESAKRRLSLQDLEEVLRGTLSPASMAPFDNRPDTKRRVKRCAGLASC